jgi:hypothetical protein
MSLFLWIGKFIVSLFINKTMKHWKSTVFIQHVLHSFKKHSLGALRKTIFFFIFFPQYAYVGIFQKKHIWMYIEVQFMLLHDCYTRKLKLFNFFRIFWGAFESTELVKIYGGFECRSFKFSSKKKHHKTICNQNIFLLWIKYSYTIAESVLFHVIYRTEMFVTFFHQYHFK